MRVEILNLTQHRPTPAQVEQGVVEHPSAEVREKIKELLTFEELPTPELVRARARALAEIAADTGAEAAMIGGAPYLMPPLEQELRKRGIKPLYAFSRRESVEEVQPDGSVRKTQVFRHLGFVEGAL
ncbi:MAG: hypothetical protein ACXQT3_03860 [Methermicoccaceae archaeon]